MGKTANKTAEIYYACEPWRVVERGFDPAHAQQSESVFSLANEHIGVRGYFEEGSKTPSLLGSYVGGVYELEGENTPGGYKGIVKQTHYMVCAADWLHARIEADGERLRIGESRIDAFERTLDFRTGALTRAFTWTLQSGKALRVTFERILSMEAAQQAAQRLTIVPEAACALCVTLGIDGATVHRATGRCDWREEGGGADESGAWLACRTLRSGQAVRYGMRTRSSAAPQGEPVREVLYAGVRYMADLRAGQTATFGKDVHVLRGTGAPTYADYEEILAGNRAYWDAFWEKNDVQIEGDDLNQQGIRFCLFQLHQTYRGLDGRHNIGAKGLTGEMYNGHAFWDTETYCLPYYLLTDPEAARALLMFRYHTLPQAKERARALDCKGACYPIATLNGEEACTLWQHASLQMQPSTAVAYGIWQYVHVTGDRAFERGEGLEMLVEICRYLASRGDWNADRTGYGFYGVMGPDEFHMMVNNNYYTNFMAKKTLDYTLRVLAQTPGADVTEEERACWRACAQAMILPRREDGVYEQHEGYFSLPHLDVTSIPREEFPLYEHWSYDRIYRTDMLKQPDVLMAMFLYPGDYGAAEKRANYDYYEPRCIHESSLSPSVHSVIASELGLHAQAQAFFAFATRMDLDNYNRNAGDGLHLSIAAAAWVTIVFGFGGLRMDGPVLSIAPYLPDGWRRYAFSIRAGNGRVRVTVDAQGTTLTREDGEPVQMLVSGEMRSV